MSNKSDVPELVRYDHQLVGTREDISGMLEDPDGKYVRYDQAVEIIAADREILENAKKEINALLVSYVREHFFENKNFQPLGSLIGQITQLDNAITITRDFKRRAEAAEAELATLKEINANLMGDDEDKPRYTTKRLKLEIERAVTAKLAQIKVQEPVGYVAEIGSNGNKWKTAHGLGAHMRVGAPLYAAPVDQTAEIEGWKNVAGEYARKFAETKIRLNEVNTRLEILIGELVDILNEWKTTSKFVKGYATRPISLLIRKYGDDKSK